MEIKLVGVTKPLNQPELVSAADLVSYCARVSNPPNQLNTGTAEGLLRYCIRHNHFSIFEMVNLVFEIETTRDIGRQILRHRSFSFQEFSQRYAKASPDIVMRETRLQDTMNKQNSFPAQSEEVISHFERMQRNVHNVAITAYEEAISVGMAKEQARALLPEGLTQTNMYMNGTLRSWIHYIIVRCGLETQKEHRDIAKAIAKVLMIEFPFIEYLKVLDDDYKAEND